MFKTDSRNPCSPQLSTMEPAWSRISERLCTILAESTNAQTHLHALPSHMWAWGGRERSCWAYRERDGDLRTACLMGTCGCIMHRANHGIWQMDCCPPCPGWTSKSHYSFDSIGALRAELGFLLRSIIDMLVGIEERTEGEVSSLLAVGRGGRVGPSKHGKGAGVWGGRPVSDRAQLGLQVG